jgi:nucleoside transporter
MNGAIRTKLCVMMVLEYMVWGAWLPLLGIYLGKDYLNFNGSEQAWIFNTFAIASLTGMFFGGQLADRYFAQEKFLAFSHLVGGLAMLGLIYQRSFWPVFGLMLLHCFFYVPTLSITNAITFANLKDSKDFGLVRAFGTIGWILASVPYFFFPTSSLFAIAGIASLALGAFCLTLPHTPPAESADASSSFAPLQAMRLLVVPTILVLFIVTFLDAVILQCHFFWTSRFLAALGLAERWIPATMSIGQIAEISTMAFLAFFLKKLGWRTTMILGMLGQVIRFGVYSFGTPETLWIVILVNIVHGFAYAFFFATVYIFVDENFPKDVRTSAQSLFNLLILGVGPFVGNLLWGWLGERYTDGTTIDFGRLFLVPTALGFVASLILAIFFRPAEKPAVPIEGDFAPGV